MRKIPPKIRLIVAISTLLIVTIACGQSVKTAEPSQVNTATAIEATPIPTSELTATPTEVVPTSKPTNIAIPYQSVVQIGALVEMEGQESIGWTGSGTIITSDGLILTNAHVVLSDRFYTVKDLVVFMTEAQDAPPVATYYADILQADAKLDLAVIRISSNMDGTSVDNASLNLPYVTLGDANALQLGDPLVILGYPGIGGDTITLTRGEVSGFTAEEPYGKRAYIKTSATIAGGNSGGLAANQIGEIIGIPTQVGSGDTETYVDCRALADTNRDGVINEFDNCVPTGGFINALRPVSLAIPLISAAQRGEVMVDAGEAQGETYEAQGETLFSDDFSDPASGWYEGSGDNGYSAYENGELVIGVNSQNYFIYSDLAYSGDGFVMVVDARVTSPVGDGDFGFICGYQDIDNMTALEISEDGYFTLWKYQNGEYKSLVEWTYSDEIAQGGPYLLAAYCGTDGLALALDETLLIDFVDPDFTPGYIGLMAGTYDNPGFKVAYDNFLLMQSEVTTPAGGNGDDGQTIFEDDFSDEASGWYVGFGDDGGSYYENGELILEVNTTNYYIYSDITLGGDELGMAVDMRLINGVGDGDFGFICGYQDGNNFSAMQVSEDDYSTIWKFIDGELVILQDWTYSDTLAAAEGTYSLVGYCGTDGLALALGEEVLANVEDSDFIPGGVGLIAGTYENSGLKIGFDNYLLIQY